MDRPTDKERHAVITAMLEGINAARYAVRPGELSPLEESHLFAEAALASLESVGFRVVREGAKPNQA